MSKADTLFNEIHGIPVLVSGLAFTNTSAGAELDVDSTYRFCADSDCYFTIASGVIAADTDGVYLPADLPEFFSTGNNAHFVNVIRHTADGTLSLAKMGSRSK
jgi:hypothetical protein